VFAFVNARTDGTHTTSTMGKMTEVIKCRETAGAAMLTDMLARLPADASVMGGLAAAVPGKLQECLALAHHRFGCLRWLAVVQLVIDLARAGTPIGGYLSRQI
jgi:gamma-glutamyltranspeptidase